MLDQKLSSKFLHIVCLPEEFIDPSKNNDLFNQVINILVNWHLSDGILPRIVMIYPDKTRQSINCCPFDFLVIIHLFRRRCIKIYICSCQNFWKSFNLRGYQLVSTSHLGQKKSFGLNYVINSFYYVIYIKSFNILYRKFEKENLRST